MVSRLLLRGSFRFFRHHPWQFWLMLLSIALGTAVIVAVDLANYSASRAFDHSVTELSGTDSHEIRAVSGYIPESEYVHLRSKLGIRSAYPVVRFSTNINGLHYSVLGVDPLALPERSGGLTTSLPWNTLLSGDDPVVLTPRAREKLGLSQGAISVSTGHGDFELSIGSVVEGLSPQWDQTLFVDISTALKLSGRNRGLDAIRLNLNEGQIEQVRVNLETGLELKSLEQRRQSFESMTAAFNTNLSAMSLLAVLVGAFLVYNTMTFSVLQRRQTFAVARMLGVTGRQLFNQLLLEAWLLGLVGSLLGILIGFGLGQFLVGLVGQTINDLYAAVNVSVIETHGGSILKSVALTLTAVTVATLMPAWEAANTAPTSVHRRSSLESRQTRWSWILSITGLLIILCSWLVLAWASADVFHGFAALFLFILGYSLLVPGVLKFVLIRLVRVLSGKALMLRLAVREIHASLSRTGLAVIALSVAVSATLGVSLMIGSFRISVSDWLDTTLRNDLYISAVSDDESQPNGRLPQEWLTQIPQIPGVASFSTGRALRFEFNEREISGLVLEPGPDSGRGFDYLQGDETAIWQSFTNQQGLLISEPLAFHNGIEVGQFLDLKTDSGQQSFKVLGVFRDYGSSQGMVVLPRDLFDRFWNNTSVSAMGVKVELGRMEDVKQALFALAANSAGTGVEVSSNAEIKAHSLMVFDRTFAVTQVLRLLVVMVAFVGVFSALMALFMEKYREFAVLRATGFTRSQLVNLVIIQSIVLGLLAAVLALPLGLVMSDMLIDVINRRSFGWSMGFYLNPVDLLSAVFLSVFAAVLAAIIPAFRIAKMNVREGLSR